MNWTAYNKIFENNHKRMKQNVSRASPYSSACRITTPEYTFHWRALRMQCSGSWLPGSINLAELHLFCKQLAWRLLNCIYQRAEVDFLSQQRLASFKTNVKFEDGPILESLNDMTRFATSTDINQFRQCNLLLKFDLQKQLSPASETEVRVTESPAHYSIGATLYFSILKDLYNKKNFVKKSLTLDKISNVILRKCCNPINKSHKPVGNFTYLWYEC